MENEITINNVKYLKENTEKKEVKRFSGEITGKLFLALSKLFQSAEDDGVNEEYAIEKGITIIDSANVCCCSAKTEKARRLLAQFKFYESEDKNEPELDYHAEKISEPCKSRYSLDYFTKIINVLKINSDSVDISVKHDYPVTLENKDFKFVLAPRIESEVE
jgi:hypothetical protein